MENSGSSIHVEVAYANPGAAHIIPLTLPSGASIKQAIEQSGILQRCPEIDLGKNKVGIFSVEHQLHDLISNGDRIEIYRPLQADPKDARRQRAQQQKKSRN